jgi:hypothetical protein
MEGVKNIFGGRFHRGAPDEFTAEIAREYFTAESAENAERKKVKEVKQTIQFSFYGDYDTLQLILRSRRFHRRGRCKNLPQSAQRTQREKEMVRTMFQMTPGYIESGWPNCVRPHE